MAVSVETPVELFTLHLGDRLDLSCAATDSAHAVNWTKDQALVVDGEHTRIRNGKLEIESVEVTDSGLYACTTFANHSALFNVSGTVEPRRVRIRRRVLRALFHSLSVLVVDTLASSEDDDEDDESSSEEAKLLGSQKELRKCADLSAL